MMPKNLALLAQQLMEIYALNLFYLQDYVVDYPDFTVITVIILFCIEFRKRNQQEMRVRVTYILDSMKRDD